jgi:hypothetical protein
MSPYETTEYQKFVATMVQHCNCASRYRPCDGVLAGGVCDNMQDEPEDYEDREDCDNDLD